MSDDWTTTADQATNREAFRHNNLGELTPPVRRHRPQIFTLEQLAAAERWAAQQNTETAA